MTGAKGHKAPLSMESDSSNGSRWEALHQHTRLEAGRPRQQPHVRAQPLVALPCEALSILKEIHAGHTHGMLCRHVTELQHQNLDHNKQRTEQKRGTLDPIQTWPEWSHVFIHLPRKYLLNTYYMPKSALSIRKLR